MMEPERKTPTILGPKTKIDEVIREYPFLEDFLLGRAPTFRLLKNPLMRSTVRRLATLAQVAAIRGIDLRELLKELAAEIAKQRGEEVTTEFRISEDAHLPPPAPGMREEILKDIIGDLHAGLDVEVLQRRFTDLIRTIDAEEMARMEQKLIEEGMPEYDFRVLSDLNQDIVRDFPREHEALVAPVGHPVHTFMLENREAERITRELRQLLDGPEQTGLPGGRDDSLRAIAEKLESLSRVTLHYQRKETQLFQVLRRRGFTGPAEVMRALHDDIRGMLRTSSSLISAGRMAEARRQIDVLLKAVNSMIHKEERILFPACLDLLSETDWERVRKDEEEIGYAWGLTAPGLHRGAETSAPGPAVALDTGSLTPEQLNLILTHLPLDLTFVNEKDEIVYYSQTKGLLFPRSPDIIGRTVQNCHPRKSLAMVQRILDDFRACRKDVAEFWVQMRGRLIHIRYFAVRDAEGTYRGTLEIGQDVTDIRAAEGEKKNSRLGVTGRSIES